MKIFLKSSTMSKNLSYLHKKSFCSNVVIFSTAEGESIEVNKYFLLLYDDFYRTIIWEGIEEQLVFIFDGYTLEELEHLRNITVLKHFKCKDLCQTSKSENDAGAGTVNIYSNDRATEEDEKLDENILLECPFKCESNSEHEWTVDNLYAHIFSRHFKQVKENFFVSIDTYIKKLKSKISNKCAFNCDESKKKNEYFNLKNHYFRCHVEEPRICGLCGETFRNLVSLKAHEAKERMEWKECGICGDGKKHKSLSDHRRYFHNPKDFKCQEGNCSKTFKRRLQLRKHTRTVHKNEKDFVCDKCGTKMSRFGKLSEHRLKVHREKFSYHEYKQIIRSGKHPFLSPDSSIPTYQ